MPAPNRLTFAVTIADGRQYKAAVVEPYNWNKLIPRQIIFINSQDRPLDFVPYAVVANELENPEDPHLKVRSLLRPKKSRGHEYDLHEINYILKAIDLLSS